MDHRELSAEITSPDGSQTFDSFREAAEAGYPIGCQWFPGCENEATVAISHPILTAVPTCAKHAALIEATDD